MLILQVLLAFCCTECLSHVNNQYYFIHAINYMYIRLAKTLKFCVSAPLVTTYRYTCFVCIMHVYHTSLLFHWLTFCTVDKNGAIVPLSIVLEMFQQ